MEKSLHFHKGKSTRLGLEMFWDRGDTESMRLTRVWCGGVIGSCQMESSLGKCEAIHFGKKNESTNYYLNGVRLLTIL